MSTHILARIAQSKDHPENSVAVATIALREGERPITITSIRRATRMRRRSVRRAVDHLVSGGFFEALHRDEETFVLRPVEAIDACEV